MPTSDKYKQMVKSLVMEQLEQYLKEMDEHEDEPDSLTTIERAKDFVRYQAIVNG